MKDSVVLDEINHDLQDQKAVEGYEACKQRAREQFDNGELSDQVLDMVADHPFDATCIAEVVLHAIDNDLNIAERLAQFCSLSITDFRAGCEYIIEKQADRLYEDGE